MSEDTQHGVGTCHVCGDEVPVDGDQATERFGEVLCAGCADEPVVFEAECQNEFCDWSYRCEETEFNRGHARQRVCQEANSHHRFHRHVKDDPMHKTRVYEVEGAVA